MTIQPPPSRIVRRGLAVRWLASKLTAVSTHELDDACHALDADKRHDAKIVEAARAFTLKRRGLAHAERAAPTKPVELTDRQKAQQQKRDAALIAGGAVAPEVGGQDGEPRTRSRRIG